MRFQTTLGFLSLFILSVGCMGSGSGKVPPEHKKKKRKPPIEAPADAADGAGDEGGEPDNSTNASGAKKLVYVPGSTRKLP